MKKIPKQAYTTEFKELTVNWSSHDKRQLLLRLNQISIDFTPKHDGHVSLFSLPQGWDKCFGIRR